MPLVVVCLFVLSLLPLLRCHAPLLLVLPFVLLLFLLRPSIGMWLGCTEVHLDGRLLPKFSALGQKVVLPKDLVTVPHGLVLPSQGCAKRESTERLAISFDLGVCVGAIKVRG
jgi:hypothetical protein